MADVKVISCVFTFLATLVIVTDASPIRTARNRRDAHALYSDLIRTTTTLRTTEARLLNAYKTDRLPNVTELTNVDVPPNLKLSEDMTIQFRINASASELLSAYRDYFMNYEKIMKYVLEDEKNTTASRNFISNMTDVSTLLSNTVGKIENVMTGHLNVPATPEEIPEEDAPYFTPKWERNVYRRRLRDCYVMEQINEQLTKAVNDFTVLQSKLN